MTDKDDYYLSSYINKHNFFAKQNPHQLHQWLLHNKKINSCSAVAAFRMTDPTSQRWCRQCRTCNIRSQHWHITELIVPELA